MNLSELLTQHPNVFLDFDGPVCAVFTTLSSGDVSTRLRGHLIEAGASFLRDASTPDDPFDLLHQVHRHQPALSELAERELSALELLAIRRATPTPGLVDMLDRLRATDHRVIIVSNNCTRAVNRFLADHSLMEYIQGISARDSSGPRLLKPSPYLLLQAASKLRVEVSDCVLLGDSVSDVQAAQHAGAHSIAFVNKPHKLIPLRQAGPNAVISSLTEVIQALTETG